MIGVAFGIVLEVVIHLWNGAPLRSLVRADVEVVPKGDDLAVLVVRPAAVFSNWLGLRAAVLRAAAARSKVVADLPPTRLVDHSVMEKLHQLGREFAGAGKELAVIGLGTTSRCRRTRSPGRARSSRGSSRRGRLNSRTIATLRSLR